MSNKLVRATDIITPADDFGERVANVVDSSGETIGKVAAQGNFLSTQAIERFARNAPLVDYTQKQPLKPKRPWTVNIGTSEPLLPGVSRVYQEQMQILFRAKQMVCSANGGKLYVTGVFVGQRVQMMQWSGNGMLMDFLKERTDVDFDTAQVGLNISVQVTNRGDTPGTFDLTLFGEACF